MPFGGAAKQQATDSPTSFAAYMLHTLEQVLFEAARSYRTGELRFDQESTQLVPDRGGVTATLVERASGEATTVRADWVIAADGAHSTVCSMLGIGIVGPGPLLHRMGIYFRADLREFGRSHPALGVPLRCYAVAPDGPIIDRSGQWPALYGVGPDGAVLVRPDGHAAWRSPSVHPNPGSTLRSVLRSVLSVDCQPTIGETR
jgi:2-polyprenyl-6-methoxyphenol hydroxylase-like FAD-dependent oxidoreductase